MATEVIRTHITLKVITEHLKGTPTSPNHNGTVALDEWWGGEEFSGFVI